MKIVGNIKRKPAGMSSVNNVKFIGKTIRLKSGDEINFSHNFLKSNI